MEFGVADSQRRTLHVINIGHRFGTAYGHLRIGENPERAHAVGIGRVALDPREGFPAARQLNRLREGGGVAGSSLSAHETAPAPTNNDKSKVRSLKRFMVK